MKEKTSNNKVHIHGYINNVRGNEFNNGKRYLIDVKTIERWQDNAGEWNKRDTFHKVQINTDDKKAIKQLDKIAADLKNNAENRGVEGFEPKTYEASFDGTLTSKKNTKDGVDYYNTYIMSSYDKMRLGKLDTENKEVSNRAEFTGTVANVNLKDDFAIVRIATRYWAPGEAENYKGETKPYHEETGYVETRINGGFREKEFEALKNGDIAVGDLINAKGQIHNNRYEDKDGIVRYAVVVDLRGLELIAKKGQKKAEAEEKKPEAKPAKAAKAAPAKAPAKAKSAVKKATPKKKSQVTM